MLSSGRPARRRPSSCKNGSDDARRAGAQIVPNLGEKREESSGQQCTKRSAVTACLSSSYHRKFSAISHLQTRVAPNPNPCLQAISRSNLRNEPLGPSSFTSFWLFSQGRIRSSGAASRCPRSTHSGIYTSPSRTRWGGWTITFTSSGGSTRRSGTWCRSAFPLMTNQKIAQSCLGGRCVYRRSSLSGTGTRRQRHTRTTSATTGSTYPAAVKFDDPKKRWKRAFERRQ